MDSVNRFVGLPALVVLFAALAMCSLSGCDRKAGMSDLKEAEFAAMPDDEMKWQWVQLDAKIKDLRGNPDVIKGRVEMLEKSQKELRIRLQSRGIDPDSIDPGSVSPPAKADP